MISSLFGRNSADRFRPTYFDIRPDSDTLWLPGEETSSTYTHLRGKVVLCLIQPVQVKFIKLHFEGWHYTNWAPDFPNPTKKHQKIPWKELPIFHQICSFLGPSKSTILEIGNYEYPFEFPLPTGLPETVEGLEDSYIRYRLKAQIGTKGSTMEATRLIRVLREYPSILVAEPHNKQANHGSQAVQNIWPHKVIYHVSMPSRAFLMGSSIPLSLRFIPLCKGLEVDRIMMRIVERHQTMRPCPAARCRDILTDVMRRVAWGELEPVYDNEGEWYSMSHMLQLPRSAKDCLQSVLNGAISVTHSLVIDVSLMNLDGHMSALVDTLPRYGDHLRNPTPDESLLPQKLPTDNLENREGLPGYSRLFDPCDTPCYSSVVCAGAIS
ncbi:hypothetical protein BDV12DRAFT_187029 [Aspergillus spectabilis]